MLTKKHLPLLAAVLLLLLAAAMVFMLRPGESAAPAPAAAPGSRQAYAPPEVTLPVRDEAPAPEDYGAVRGTLFDDRGQRLPFRELVFVLQDGRLPFSTTRVNDTTDREGNYWMERLPAGAWGVGVCGDGFHNSTFTSLAAFTVWKDQVTTLDLFLPGTRILEGNLTHVLPGSGLRLTLRNAGNGQVVARGLACNLEYPKEALPEEPPDPLPPEMLPGYFRFEGLYPTKYVLAAVPDADFPEVLEKLLEPFEVEVDLTVGDEVLPPRSFRYRDFGLPFDEEDVKVVETETAVTAAEKREQ